MKLRGFIGQQRYTNNTFCRLLFIYLCWLWQKLVANLIPIQNISISLIGKYKHPFKYSRKKEILLSACTCIKY